MQQVSEEANIREAINDLFVVNDNHGESRCRIKVFQLKKESAKFIYSQVEVILNFYFHYLFMNMSET